jgi:MerR family Zn(II)-responsive transcriptional regulator of zntA
MRVGELAERCGLSTDTIRFYEKRGLLHEAHVRRSENGYRHYNETAAERLGLIKGAQAAGFTLAEIVDLFKEWEANALTDDRIEVYLREKCAQIAAKVAELQQVQRYLEEKICTVTKATSGESSLFLSDDT